MAIALGVTFEGLRDFTEDKVLYNTNNFYDNCGVTASNIVANVETLNNPLKETIEMFERQLQAARKDLLEIVKNNISRNEWSILSTKKPRELFDFGTTK